MDMDDFSIVFVCVSLTSTVGVVLSLSLIAVNFKHRNDRLVKMSSPTLNIVMLLGAILLYVTNVLYGMTSLVTCRLFAWLLPVSFSLLFGCLFVKSWRVNRIFTNPHLTKTIIKDGKLLLMVGGLVLVDLVILTIWEVLEATTGHTDVQELPTNETNQAALTQSPLHVHLQCSCTYGAIFLAILLLYKGLYLMYGAYLAWAIRHVTIPPMDDSSCILIASHVTVISGCLAISAQAVLTGHEAAGYACVAASIWLSTTVTVMLEFLPKIHYWFKHQNDDFLKVTLTPYLHQSTAPTPNILATPKPETPKTDENENTDLQEVVSQVQQTADPETPMRPLADRIRKPDSPDSGHDSPRSVLTLQGNLTMYQIENELEHINECPLSPKPSSVGSAGSYTPKDLHDVALDSHVMRKRMYYDYLRRTRKLADRITETYELNSDSDTMTYISNCLTPSPSVCLPNRQELWTLESDHFYPRNVRKEKRVKRKSRSQRDRMTGQRSMTSSRGNLPMKSSASVI